jgi:hypothetical protein
VEYSECVAGCCDPGGSGVSGYGCAADEEFAANQRVEVGVESFAVSVDDD